MAPCKRVTTSKRVQRGDSDDEGSSSPKKVTKRAPATKKQGASPRTKKAPVRASPARTVVGDEDEDETSLAGLKIVVTGVPATITREALERKLKDAGAQVTSAVSGVTNILIYGPKLEDGRDITDGSKYRKAQELVDSGKSKAGLKILSEEEFFETYPNFGKSEKKEEESDMD